MRMRPKKHREERLAAVNHLFAVIDKEGKVILNESFDNCNDTILEIGCGKGTFTIALADRFKDKNLIALEKVPDVLVMAMEKAAATQLDNLKFLCADANDIDSLFAENSISAVYLNFCDPWHKKRNHKRRLTYRDFLNKYRTVLKPNAVIYFKTDNRDLFDFSLEEFKYCGFELKNVCYDLHNSELNADNIQTEYEKNFSAKGFSINYCEAIAISLSSNGSFSPLTSS